MTTDRKLALQQTAIYLLSAILCGRVGFSLGGTEFSGGRMTGPLLSMNDIGSLLFVVALFWASFYGRIAAAAGLIACLLCFPVYLYFAAPGPFRWIFRGEYSVPVRDSLSGTHGRLL